MQIKLNNVSFGYNGENLFENLNFEVNTKDKIAIIGKNGSGKTTILKILTGEIELHQPDNALPVLSITGSPTIGTLKQMTFEDESITLYEEILKCYEYIISLEEKINTLQRELETNYSDKLVSSFSKTHDEFEMLGGYSYKAELDEVLSVFGFFEDKNKKLCEFSGGQKTKISFIKLILSKPDVLLLDEPTNHLDIKSVYWLENYIKLYKKAVIIVSHDRTFLDNTIDIVYELEYKKFKKYVGNYSKFLETKQNNYDSQLRAYEAQQREIADIKEFIERFRYKATKANAVQSRIKMLEKMEIIQKPEKNDNRAFRARITPSIASGSEVLYCSNLKIGYSKENILSTVDFKLLRGERLGIIGGNGLGKSTLLKVLTEKLAPISGHFKFGFNVEYGYFEQLETKHFSTKSIYEHYQETFPDLSGNEVRSALGAFLFSGKAVDKKLCELSGGEIVRLELCKMLEKKPNLIILDEPTNHMDITSKETLENLLLGYEGTIIFVSHDRYFVNKIATKLLVFEEGKATFFDGTYKEFKEPFSKSTLETQENRIPEIKPEKIEYPIDYGEEPEDPLLSLSPYMAGKEKNKLSNRLKKIEENSRNAEEHLKQLNLDFVDPEIASDFKKLMEVQADMENTQISIDKYAEEWLEISEKLAKLESILSKNNEEKTE
ncbi:MAG: ABC-F family ATP-binding cassette domain-containing protein [Clostridia bacterium]|nr:ABC-F family ATP-binding cassette domain-containing protein [Clostridia bacterium]